MVAYPDFLADDGYGRSLVEQDFWLAELVQDLVTTATFFYHLK
jgi:hypothetical protein